jgi:hypothetical protein
VTPDGAPKPQLLRFNVVASEKDIKLPSCQRSAHSLEEKLGIADPMGAINDLNRLAAKIKMDGVIGRVVHDHTHGPTKGGQRQVTQSDRA